MKVFIHRNSVLTDLMELNHLQSVYNISVALCVLLLINAVLYYMAAPQKFLEDLQLIRWASGKLHVFFTLWISLNVAAITVHQGFRFWANNRHCFNTKVMDNLFIICFAILSALMFTVTPYVVRKLELAPITAFSILAEQVRIFMKIYSFVRENVPRVLNHDSKKDGDQTEMLCPSFQYFIYFMFVPALVYRDSYPRTPVIRWGFVVTNFVKLFACVFITYCIFHRFNVDIFRKVGVKPIPLQNLILTLAGSMLVGSLMMFLIFYGILHCWLNAFAEMFRFGDRLFYKDWWNSTSFSQYYRMWNGVVYDWLYTYIHVDIHKMGFDRWKSMMIVFIVSAIVHEYIIAFALGFFFPVLAVVYSTVGVSVVFLTKSKTSQPWNTFMWGMLFSGWGLLTFLYCMEWYARTNCPRIIDGPMDYFVPRSWSCNIVSSS